MAADPTPIPLHVANRSEQELLYAIYLAVTGGVVASTVAISQVTDGTTNAVHLKAGTAIAGKFGIDQTTPGTTNKVDSVAQGAPTDRSGTITTGGTAQTAANALATRRYFFLQNNSDTGLWFNYGVTAVAAQPSIYLAPGASYENPAHWCPSGLISVIGATTGKTFTMKEN